MVDCTLAGQQANMVNQTILYLICSKFIETLEIRWSLASFYSGKILLFFSEKNIVIAVVS